MGRRLKIEDPKIPASSVSPLFCANFMIGVEATS
jgi:hypothetical protein